MQRPFVVMLVALVVSGAIGCAHRAALTPPGPSPRPSPSPQPRPAPGYEARIDSLDAVDPAPLAGRRIVLDPGHGGLFRGAVGVNGLTEAQVNLAVALELAPLLEQHGAKVLLTRREDRDFLTRADSSLRGDLAERVRMANAFAPDFFLSIHHNADPGGTHDRNETQTYYKLGDEGASLDAAACLHRYLRRNLGIAGQRILPGNYFVLRNSDAPAALTEASYITNPDVEARLVLEEKRRLEAQALYLGIARYFGRGAPTVTAFAAVGRDGRSDTSFVDVDGPMLVARMTGAFDRVDLELDGRRLDPVRTAERIEWRPERALPVGRHEARLRVALSGAGSAPTQSLAFRLERRPASLRAQASPDVATAWMGVRIEVLDRAGLPCLQPLKLRVKATRPGAAPAETVVTSRDGIAWAYLRLSRAARGATGPLATITAGTTAAGIKSASVATPARSARAAAFFTGWAERRPEGERLRDAPGTAEPTPTWHWINRDGFVVLPRDSVLRPPALPGFRAWGTDTLPPRLVAIAQGALIGRRIVLDPDGGGEDSGGMGTSGTRASFYNVQVAQALASMLEASGAAVALARRGDVAASDVERVRASEEFHADRYLRIGHRPEPPHIGSYFSSAPGKTWGAHVASWLARLGLPAPPVQDDAQYPLQQTSCTAIYVATRRVDDAADEAAMNEPGAVRAEAYALYLALLEEWTSGAGWPLDSLEVRDAEGRPAAGAVVTLGGALVLETDAHGSLRFARTEAGPIEALVDHPAVRTRGLLLESQRNAVLTGPNGR
jgi:N-acetylmuramoyl-L-alanine amidase